MEEIKPFDSYIIGNLTIDEFDNLANTACEESSFFLLGLTQEEFALYKRLGSSAIEDIKKAHAQKRAIIDKAKTFFRDEIAASHRQNTKKLKSLKAFNLNPFLDKYKANFLLGNNSPISIAKALVYPRVLGTSINTTFGNKLQKFCSTVLDGYASTTSGIDIEFVDLIDGHRKYCQVKAGPNTINKDDVKTIIDHFTAVKNLARTNNLTIGFNDLIVGVFYGTPEELSGHYKVINKNYPVIVGRDFWYRLTGDENFYTSLTDAIGDVASEYDGSQLINEVINELAKEIKKTMED
ncbi:MAG TPA: PmeII family type II restriction endonuclease [Clostridia bacterium]|nr:PmeII family type II restriction endonuclease [Clostridia bacterium]